MRIAKPSVLTVALLTIAGVSIGGAHDPAPQPANAHAPAAAAAQPAATVSPDDALKRLVEGNQRYLSQQSEHARADQARRCDTFANGQHPFAVVLSCADSRAPVELIFDQGIGDLFVVRVAGNVADTDEVGTVEYGAGHLGSPLVVVLGHTKCGAVTAVVNGAKVSENIAKLVDNIAPAAEVAKRAQPALAGDALVQKAIELNVMQAIQEMLGRSEEMRHLVSQGKVKVVGAVYDLHNGTIQWLGEHPRQAELLKGAHTATIELRDVHSDDHKPKATAEHGKATSHPEPSSSAQPMHSPAAPHQTGTLKGMLIPAAFLGGAGIISGAVIFRMKSHAPGEPPPSEQAAVV